MTTGKIFMCGNIFNEKLKVMYVQMDYLEKPHPG